MAAIADDSCASLAFLFPLFTRVRENGKGERAAEEGSEREGTAEKRESGWE